jgi:hypothetical protein
MRQTFANYISTSGLHMRQTCCIFCIRMRFAYEPNLLQILFLHQVYTRGKSVENLILSQGLQYICTVLLRGGYELVQEFAHICKLVVYTRAKLANSCKLGICDTIYFKFTNAQTKFFVPCNSTKLTPLKDPQRCQTFYIWSLETFFRILHPCPP